MRSTWANKAAFILICAIVILSTLLYGTVHQPILALFYISVTTLLILWALDAYLTTETRISGELLQIPLLLLGAYALLQAIPFGTFADAGVADVPRTISLDPFWSKVTALHIFALSIFFAVALSTVDRVKRIDKLVKVITIFGFAYAFFAILQSVLSPTKIYGIYERQFAAPFGSFVNRHNFAAYINMTMSLPLGMLFAGAVTKDKRLLYITAIALMGVSLLLSGSRGGLVSFVAMIFILLILTTGTKSRKKLLLKGVLTGALGLGILAGSIFVGGETSLSRLGGDQGDKGVSSDRTQIWKVTLKVIGDNLPLGAGLGAFGRAYTIHDDQSGLANVEQAHNDYLQIIADAGVPGFLIGAFFLFLILRLGFRSVKIENKFRRAVALGAFAGCFAVLVHSLFDFVLHVTAVSILFITLMTILAACQLKYTDDITDPDERPSKKHRRKGSVRSIAKAKTELIEN